MERPKQHPVLSAFKFVLTLSVILMLFWVCNSGDQKKEESSAVAAPSFKMNTVIITKTQLESWYNNGWFNPPPPAKPIKKMLLQFYSTAAPMSNSNMQLIAWGARTYTDVPTDSLIGEIDPKYAALEPKDTMILANNYIDFKDLKIFKPNGTFIDFSFIRIIPVQDKGNRGNYIVFKTETVLTLTINGTDSAQVLSSYTSDPCPKYCKPDAVD